jgi:hypothetical protein
MNISYNKNLEAVVEVLSETALVTTNLENKSVSKLKKLLPDQDCSTNPILSIARRCQTP